jgi:NAD(P)-dependent dehydrogenase (short-subunit alcohol dehydrogenase family)
MSAGGLFSLTVGFLGGVTVKDFTGKIAVVTGAASGIGRALAEKFIQEGMKVVLADIEEAALSRTEADLRKSGASVLAVVTDVSKADDVDALAQRTISEYGAVHILCSNAGVGGDLAWSWEHAPEMWGWVLGVNLWGVIHGIRSFVPIMLSQKTEAHVVNTASIGGLTSLPFFSPYHAAKFAVVSLSESLHYELSMQQSKVRVSVLCPGFVSTDIMDLARNRPSCLQDHVRERSVIPQAWYDAWNTFIAAGTPPKQIAEHVTEAVREERFYVLPHPDMIELVRTRMETILKQRNPVLQLPDVLNEAIEASRLARQSSREPHATLNRGDHDGP